nr:RsmB/NOP family class I SAM-dependent RNA methyltransferase [Altericroceibacterium endophyticum]
MLDDIISAARNQGAPADRIIAEWFRTHRFAGSKDRRAIRDLVYDAIRCCGPVPASGRAAALRLAEGDPAIRNLFDGSNYGPSPVGEREQPAAGGVAPDWIMGMLDQSDIHGEEAQALLDRAPLDIRVNSLKAQRDSADLPIAGTPLPSLQGLRLPQGTKVEQWPAYRDGLVEVQDLGSQLACEASAAQPGETVVDLCAGAGGKTLALAAMMQNSGTLLAADTDRGRLGRLAPRAERAGALVSDTLLLNPGKEMEALADVAGQADMVFVDAPCSGTGTWRRKPEARWRITPDQLQRYADLQNHVLEIGARLVKPGGRLIYVTCSVLDEEGASQIDRFLKHNPDWSAQPVVCPLGQPRGAGVRLTPHHDGTDGFFIACIGKR